MAAEGVIVLERSADGKRAAIVEVNCETDFVAREKDFQNFASAVAKVALEQASGRRRRAWRAGRFRAVSRSKKPVAR